MASYVIGDIHGAYDEFVRLLTKINFRYDGSDSLYLLGDYGDWGERSMETILFVKELDERYPFVHCLAGNHELMFVRCALEQRDQWKPSEESENWLYRNRGMVTWTSFLQMDRDRQDDLIRWLQGLKLSCNVRISGLHLMLAHAYPYYYDMAGEGREEERRREDAVWRRLRLHENPFSEYRGELRYDYFICGHTITSTYEREQRREKGRGLIVPPAGVRNRIFHGEMFIDIDCGAKCIGLEEDANEHLRAAAGRAQLAALCLDTMQEFYIHRQLPGVPDMEELVPQVRLPETLEDVPLPKWKIPEIKLPDLDITKIWK